MKTRASRALRRYWATTDKKTRELSQAIWATYYPQPEGEIKNPHTLKKRRHNLLAAVEAVEGQRKVFIREKPETVRKKRRGKGRVADADEGE